MTNILNIFEYYSTVEKDLISETVEFLKRNKSNAIDFTTLSELNELQFTMKSLNKQTGYSLVGNGCHIDYLLLVEHIQSGKMEKYVALCRMIKAEMMRVTNVSNFMEFKRINDYWENLLLTLEMVIK